MPDSPPLSPSRQLLDLSNTASLRAKGYYSAAAAVIVNFSRIESAQLRFTPMR